MLKCKNCGHELNRHKCGFESAAKEESKKRFGAFCDDDDSICLETDCSCRRFDLDWEEVRK